MIESSEEGSVILKRQAKPPLHPRPHAAQVGGQKELREDYGPGYRVDCARHGSTLIVLLAGGDKRTQQKDIEHAQRYWQDWKRRKAR